jgi:urease accessory protein
VNPDPAPGRRAREGLRGFAARAAVAAERDPDGQTRISRLRSDGPLALRASGGPAVYLVGAGAGPLGGDDLELTVDVGPGARLEIRSAAATVVLPGRGGRPSRLVVRARVGAGAGLVFRPEPSVAAAGCDHRAVADVTLEEGAELAWQEEIVLGRHGERPGRFISRIDVTACGVPLLRHELRVDDDADSSAVLGDAKAVGAVLLAGPGLTAEPYAGEGLAVLPLAGPGVLVTALAPDAVRLRERLERGRSAADRVRV